MKVYVRPYAKYNGGSIAAANYDKRLTDYWERWGSSKLQAWTYWTEA